MSDTKTAAPRIILGDPVPWFGLPVVTGGSFDLHAGAGRWGVLSFVGSLGDPRAIAEGAAPVHLSASFGDEHLVIGCVFTGRPSQTDHLAAISSPTLSFLADHDGAVSRSFGADGAPRNVILDSMLRAVADIAL